jgi:hypothetical protein
MATLTVYTDCLLRSEDTPLMLGFARRAEGWQKGAEKMGSRSIVFIENNSQQFPVLVADEGCCHILESVAHMH